MKNSSSATFVDEIKEILFLLAADIQDSALEDTQKKLIKGWEKRNAKIIPSLLPHFFLYVIKDFRDLSHGALLWLEEQLNKNPGVKNDAIDFVLSSLKGPVKKWASLPLPQTLSNDIWKRFLVAPHDEESFFSFFKQYLQEASTLTGQKKIVAQASQKYPSEKLLEHLPNFSPSDRKEIVSAFRDASAEAIELSNEINLAMYRGLSTTVKRLVARLDKLSPRDLEKVNIDFPAKNNNYSYKVKIKSSLYLGEMWDLVSNSAAAKSRLVINAEALPKRFMNNPSSFSSSAVKELSSLLSPQQNRKIAKDILELQMDDFRFYLKTFSEKYLELHNILEKTPWDISSVKSLKISAGSLAQCFENNFTRYDSKSDKMVTDTAEIAAVIKDMNKSASVPEMFEKMPPVARCAVNAALSQIGVNFPGEEKPFTLDKNDWVFKYGELSDLKKGFLRHLESYLSRVKLTGGIGVKDSSLSQKKPKM